MKRNLIAIIALLTVGVMTAQSKTNLEEEFKSLEKEIEKVNSTYSAKLTTLEKELEKEEERLANEPITDEDLKDFEKFEKNTSTEDVMKLFIEIYEGERATEKSDFVNNNNIEELSTKEKEYLTVLKELDTKTLRIEKKMYNVAKKYFSKK